MKYDFYQFLVIHKTFFVDPFENTYDFTVLFLSLYHEDAR